MDDDPVLFVYYLSDPRRMLNQTVLMKLGHKQDIVMSSLPTEAGTVVRIHGRRVSD
jgi:hypothetical protein